MRDFQIQLTLRSLDGVMKERKILIFWLHFQLAPRKFRLFLTRIEIKTYFLRELNPGPEEMQPKITIKSII